jgi:uncharacterized protein YbjQ (UPF0145 family)
MIVKLVCPDCGRVNPSDSEECWKCKRPITDEERQSAIAQARAKQDAKDLEQDAQDKAQHDEELKLVKLAKESGDWSEVPADLISREARNIILTTSFEVAGRQIDREIEILTSECVYGMNVFRDLFAAVRDVFGGRSKASQKVLRDARKTALAELRGEALMVGADAVIAVDLDYQEFSGYKDGSMLMIVASGTAVKLK